MPLGFRIGYAASLIILFSCGFVLHLMTPMAKAVWQPWCVISFALLVLILREILRSNSPGGSHAGKFFSLSLNQGYFSFIFLLIFLSLSLLYLYVEKKGSPVLSYYLSNVVNFGLWTPLGVMIFFGLKLSNPKLSVLDTIITFSSLVLSIVVFASGLYYYQARILVITIICLIFLFKGNISLKILVFLAVVLYYLGGILVVSSECENFYPQYAWLFSGMSELNASYDLVLRQTVVEMAGFWGTGGRYIQEVSLPLSDYLSYNCLPYLSLVGGYISVGMYILSLFFLVGSLFYHILEIRGGWAGNVSAAVLLFFAIDYYMSIVAMLKPFGLIMGGGANGLPFIGSFESGSILATLTLFVISAHKVARQNTVEIDSGQNLLIKNHADNILKTSEDDENL
ncbi:MAG: hypothetical protein LBR53_02925 [Deltaproteobacteria bacterium]|nr:hypothetical protein [Deltaproteobacteria bacterium]